MHRYTKVPLLPIQSVQRICPLKIEHSLVICKSDFLNFILEMLKLNRLHKLLFRIGLMRMFTFVYHAMLMFITAVYISISCVLHVLCMCSPLEAKW